MTLHKHFVITRVEAKIEKKSLLIELAERQPPFAQTIESVALPSIPFQSPMIMLTFTNQKVSAQAETV